MKIGIISNLYPPFLRGGAEIVAALQAEGLKESWQHTFVISTRPSYVKFSHSNFIWDRWFRESRDNVNGIDVFRFFPLNIYYYLEDYKYPAFIRLLWHFFDIFNFYSYFKIKKILEREKPDIIITHNLMGIGFLIPKLLKKMSIKHVHLLHDVQLVTPSGLILKGEEGAFKHKFFKWIGYEKLMRYLMGNPELVLAPSKFLFDFYKQANFFPKSKKYILPNPIKSLISLNRQTTPNLELVYLGQINKAKGILDLIDSFRKLQLPHARLNIIGVGEDINKAKALARDDKRIKFYGWLNHQKMEPLLSKMDLMLVPSLCYENSPAVVYESLSMGMPVLVSDIGGAAELVRPGENGWKFPAGDFRKLNKMLISIYQQREKLPLMMDNCRASVANYVLSNYSKHLLDILNEDDK